MRENIVCGDLHGVRDEFNQLLDQINYDPKRHRIILLGDVLDRGIDPVGLLHQIRKMDIESVLGNHEEKALRWRRHEALKELTGQDNPIQNIPEKRQEEWRALSQDDLRWISNLPTQIHIKDNWYVIHGGMEPAVPFDQQDPQKVIRLRYVNEEGYQAKFKPNIDKPHGAHFWATRWLQPYNLIFGHERHPEPTKYINKNNICVAVDCGCVFGNMLAAYNLERDEFITVKAAKKYYQKSVK